MMSLPIEVPMDKIEAFCRHWKIWRMWLFGSVLREDFGPESDVDILVEFSPEARWNLLDLVEAEQELSQLLGRPVDLVERQCVEQSSNWIRRRYILENVRELYVAR
ncbi:MAG: nucleotidyltransferase family protein [Thermoguttaceae bacterium]|nr:nucleotidyltransferase family protein [Thermoguttaceae bacterium]MDW8037339.1 nucleotidyltransferase family protein [Thermoguttaceae bacterium]